MQKRVPGILWILCALFIGHARAGQNGYNHNVVVSSGAPTSRVELVRNENEVSFVRLETVRMGKKSGLAVIFEGTGDLHYYANGKTAPAPNLELRVEAKSPQLSFQKAIFPKWTVFRDSVGQYIDVYVGNFIVFVPLDPATLLTGANPAGASVEVKISGVACTSLLCLPPFEKTLSVSVDLAAMNSWRQVVSEPAAQTSAPAQGPSYQTWFALLLALLAGLSLNIMPCVWPVVPLVVMRIIENAKRGKSRSFTTGLAFCLGILLFFIALAGANIILRIFYGTVLQWGDQFRSPNFVAAMALLLVVLALFMFGVFTVAVPSLVAGKSGSGKGYTGAVGMGFLAAVLSTPCSFGILAAAFAWAQSQQPALAALTIVVIGVGMAVPYAVLTALPQLLAKLPRAGRWMELFKQTIGFVLLVTAVKLITALPESRRAGVLYFAVVLAFCVWMWSGWVGFNTKPIRKWVTRIVAAALAITVGFLFLPAPASELIDWQPYDADIIDTALGQGRPVLIKFTADWCLTCKTIEKVVYSRKDIAELIKQKSILPIKADTTQRDYPATLALKRLYNEPGVPVSMLLVPGRKEPARWRGILFADRLKQSLTQLPDKG